MSVDTLTLADADKPDFLKLIAPILRRAYATCEFFWIYGIQAGDDGPIKIGVAKKPNERIKTLQTANAAPLKGLGAWRGLPGEEKSLHDQFAYLRIRGEWFEPAPELVELIVAVGCTYYDWPEGMAA